MYSKDLTEPLATPVVRRAVDIGLASVEDLTEVATMVEHADRKRVQSRLDIYRNRVAGGSFCFVARADGAIVASNWIRVRSAVGAENVEMAFKEHEIYTTDAYTTRDFRGFGIHTALNHAMLVFAQQRGFKAAYTMVNVDNTASWVTMPRVGWRHAGSLLVFQPSWAPAREVWRAAGSVYPMPARRQDERPRKTLADLGAFDNTVLISDRPWSKTYRMQKDGQISFLKIVARERAGILRASDILASNYPSAVPAVIACDDRQMGWLLTADHHGQAIDAAAESPHMSMMVEAVAALQQRAAQDQRLQAALPWLDPALVWPRFMEFMRREDPCSDDADRIGAGCLLGADEAAARVAELARLEDVLQTHLTAAAHLPRALEHGNLHPSNAAFTGDGHCVLCNWTAACWGPLGLSLFPLFADELPIDCPVAADSDGLASRSAGSGLMATYVRALASGSFADPSLLRERIPASVAIGLVRYLTRFGEYPSEDPVQLELMRRELRSGVRSLLSLGSRLAFASR